MCARVRNKPAQLVLRIPARFPCSETRENGRGPTLGARRPVVAAAHARTPLLLCLLSTVNVREHRQAVRSRARRSRRSICSPLPLPFLPQEARVDGGA